ncbi:hypothetical protein O6H91_02G054000 [Diphasiastrum complanatum]|uniref:Uncharacterized protein n=1 Tax=Diphasiastrum complanatum TaxID=34168 RepID=A0ACC2EFI5_DIPCM|nr:hypothetical protein O6H91_02G054000 [Diphasiastrum complanatum]
MRILKKAVKVGIQHTTHVIVATFLLLLLGFFALNAYYPSFLAGFDFNRDVFEKPFARKPCKKLNVSSYVGSNAIKDHGLDFRALLLEANEERILQLSSMWEASSSLDGKYMTRSSGRNILPKEFLANMPLAPHLENCKSRSIQNRRQDTRDIDGKRPSWLPWKGQLGADVGKNVIEDEDVGEEMLYNATRTMEGPYPPWVEGAVEDNLPMTRRVQRDIWLHQHPQNCSDPRIKFLFAKWDQRPNLGLGALIISMSGILANALEDKRVLVTDYFTRADHHGCKGAARSQWSCYFLPETSKECRQRALDLSKQKKGRDDGVILIVDAGDFSPLKIWFSKIPEYWGEPWKRMHPTTEVDDKILIHHNAMDRRWWRAQAVRYLMRFPSEYTCKLLNKARHKAFGHEAAAMVLQSLPNEWPQRIAERKEGPMEHLVWSSQRPWIPRPLTSIHVRLGDKASEMKLVSFDGYMKLATRVRSHFPQARNIWLSTEMQDVIEQSKLYSGWSFYYSKVTRQTGNTSMHSYETGLGRRTSTNNAFVNLLMAADADFFIGALGSTWCILIDGLRCTGGKEMAGYLSVNKDRYW